MQVIPSIDLLNGEVVRLYKGKPNKAKSYKHLGDPIDFLKKWESEGARIVHVIDLNAALGSGDNRKVIKSIVEAAKGLIQVGGGIRTLEKIRILINMGIEKIILGSIAFKDTTIIEAFLKEYSERHVVVALDHFKGNVMKRGWKTFAKISVEKAASKFMRIGVKNFLVTSVDRDGTLLGPDLETLNRISRIKANIISAGGIKSLNDLESLKKLNIKGAIIGKALYEGLFTLKQALKIVED
jgi:phosphoribosylformimino-5-aminoimidazole carboxamide ribotide isomerase